MQADQPLRHEMEGLSMKYMLTIFEHEDDMLLADDPEKSAAYWEGWTIYSKAAEEAGIVVFGEALQPPSTATTVRGSGASRTVQDGPFPETKEQLGGFFIIDVPDLDAALDWAARCPAATRGAIEVRPVLEMEI
ncbi:MAG: YciI family protein [Pseudomonadota bacterium]